MPPLSSDYLLKQESRSAIIADLRRQAAETDPHIFLRERPSAARRSWGAPLVLKRPEVKRVLPWLLVTTDALDSDDRNAIVELTGMTTLYQMNLQRHPETGALMIHRSDAPPPPLDSALADLKPFQASAVTPLPLHSRDELHDGVGLLEGGQVTDEEAASQLVDAVCSLHRLVHRRGHLRMEHSNPDFDIRARYSTILLHCPPDSLHLLSTMLAAYFHFFCGQSLAQGCHTARAALGAQSNLRLLLTSTRQLERDAYTQLESVSVMWKYGGDSVALAGEPTGGWGHRSAMEPVPSEQFGQLGCTPGLQCWKKRLAGLNPGTYLFNFIVDWVWRWDVFLPTMPFNSARSMYSNVLKVPKVARAASHEEHVFLVRWAAVRRAHALRLKPKAAVSAVYA